MSMMWKEWKRKDLKIYILGQQYVGEMAKQSIKKLQVDYLKKHFRENHKLDESNYSNIIFHV